MKFKVAKNGINLKKHSWVLLLMAAVILAVGLFLYYDQRNQLSATIQGLGLWGPFLAVLLMILLCMTPVPSEGLVVLFLKIYGIYWGTFFAWMGSVLSSLVIFAVARIYGKSFMDKLIPPDRFKMVDQWVKRKGSIGLFIARLLPIPAFAVNYVAGVIPSVRLWPYLWTAALSIIPYYVGTALVFLGVSREIWTWLIVGSIAIIAFWGIGYLLNRKRFF